MPLGISKHPLPLFQLLSPTGPSCCCCSVTKSCPILCDSMDCSLPDSFVHGSLQARILEWLASSFSRGSSLPRIEPRSPALQADSLPTELSGKPNVWQGEVKAWSFCMWLKLYCYWLKIECYILCELHYKHKAETYSRYGKDKEKGIKAYHYAKSSIQNGRQQERKKGTKEILTGYKTIR